MNLERLVTPSHWHFFTARRESGRYLLIAAAAGFGAAAATIWWFDFQLGATWGGSYHLLLDNTWPTLARLSWPMVALLGFAAVWVTSFARLYGQADPARRVVAWAEMHYPFCLCMLAMTTALLLAAGVIALRAFPNSGDEYTYLFQAETFRAGRLWNVPPPVPDVFASPHVLIKDGKWVSQYPLGWPLIIAGVTSLGLPAYVAAPTMALLLLFGFACLTRELVSPGAALVGTVLLVCCPFFLLNGASYFSHTPAALFSVVTVLCGVRFLKTGSILSALGAGAALGFLFIIRPFSAVLIAVPCAIELLRRAGALQYTRLAWFFLGSFPFVAGFLLYDNTVTGSPLIEPISWGYPKLHLGLHPVDEWGNHVTLFRSAGWAIIRFMELAEWTSPLFCLLYAAAALWKLGYRKLVFYDFVFPLFVLGYVLYPSMGDNRYGPRYYFEAYPFMVLTVISATTTWLTAWRGGSRAAAMVGVQVGAIIMGLAAFPALAYQFRGTVNARMELYDLVNESRLSNAIVLIRSHVGGWEPVDLTRDGIDLSQRVLYVLDQPAQYCTLIRAFPGRTLYRYERRNDTGTGILHAVQIDNC
jgi:hypothetical protein